MLNAFTRRIKDRSQRRARPAHPFRHRQRLWIERLEDRLASSVNPGSPFEIDGNARDGSSPVQNLPDDWNTALHSGILPAFQVAGASHAIADTGVVADKASIDTTFFKGGGSKDVNDVNQ